MKKALSLSPPSRPGTDHQHPANLIVHLLSSRLQSYRSSCRGLTIQCTSVIRSWTIQALKGHKSACFIFNAVSRTLHDQSHLPAQTPIPKPAPSPEVLDSFTGLFATVPCVFTPATILSRFVSITTPPTIISDNVACKLSKLKMRSSSHTFSNSLSSASTYTWIRSISARGDSVEVEIIMKNSVA